MGLVERKEREKIEMKRQILNAARRLFLEQGYEKTSIRNIADAIEYSPGTIYLYFKDKNELLFTLHQEAFVKLIEELQIAQSEEEPFKRLTEMGRHYMKYAYENPELYELMFVMIAPMETLECREEVWHDGKIAFGMLTSLVAECQKVGYFKNKDLINISLGIWSFMHGLVMLHTRRRMSIFEITEQKDRQDDAYGLYVEMLGKI